MSFNKKLFSIFMIFILAAVMVGCSAQTTAPTATVAPTVEEPTAVPEEPAAEAQAPAEEPAAKAETPAEEPATEAEAPVEEPAVEVGTPAEEPAAEAEVPAEEPAAEAEASVEEPAAEAEVPAEKPADEAETPMEEPAAEAEASVEEPAAEAEVPAEITEEVREPEEQKEDEQNAEQFAATVDGEGVSIESFIQTTTFNRYQYLNMYNQYAQMYSMYGLPLDSLNEQVVGILGEEGKERLGSEAIDQLTYDKVLAMEAKEAGLEISEKEVYDQLKSMFGYEDPAAEEEGIAGMDSFNVTLNATESEDDKNDAFRRYAQEILNIGYDGKVSFDYLKNYAKNILTDNKLFEQELDDRIFEAEMVSARHILVEDEDTAKEIISKLEAGEDWAALASEHSLDTANKDQSGDLGWFGHGEMVPEFENAAFALEPGEISKTPVKSDFGFHIIASDGKEVRPLSGSALEEAKNAAYEEWTLSLRAKHDIQSYPEVWMDAVPMEPAFVPPAAPSTEETDDIAETEPVETPAEAANTVEEAVDEAEPTVEGTVEDTAGKVESAVEETAIEATDAVEDTAGKAESAVEKTADEAANAVEDTAGKAESAVEKTADEAANAVGDTAGTAESAVEKTADEAANVIEETVNVAESEDAETDSKDNSESKNVEIDDQVVARIDGTPITADEFVTMAVFNRYQILSTYNQNAQFYSMLGMSMDDINAYYEEHLGEAGREELGTASINQLAYFKMLEKEAEKTGIEVSNKEAVAQMKQSFGFEEDTKEAESSLGLDSFNLEADSGFESEDEDTEFRAQVDMDLGLAYDDKISYDFFLDYVRHSMLETALIEKVLEGRVFEEEQVNARHILVEEEETAKELLARLDEGEEWDALAAEYSKDTGNKDNGGALGWFGHSVMVPEFEEAAFALEPGEISEPVKTSFGWHIIASDGKEIRPMEDEALEAAQKEVYQEWYEDLKAGYKLESYPEVWLNLVPMEPVFEPIKIETTDEAEVPTFHIISDDETVEDDDVVQTIANTEQDEVAYTINNNAEENKEATPTPETPEKTKDDVQPIKNTEQEEVAYSLSNSKENN